MLSLSLTRRLLASRPLGLRTLSTSASQSTDAEQAIVSKLTERFSPTELAVQDVSGGCGSFFAIKIASEAFKGLPTIKQHKLVTEVLKKEIGGIHGLQVRVRLFMQTRSNNFSLLARLRRYPRHHKPLVLGLRRTHQDPGSLTSGSCHRARME
ncbi:bola protein [Phlebopus sp. FC_14]|nr:bola protein [Phlebopus sp. FC_14]